MSEQKEQPTFEDLVAGIVDSARKNIQRVTNDETKSATERAKDAFIKSGQIPPISLEGLTPGEQLTVLTKWSGQKGPQGQEMFHQWYEFDKWEVVDAKQGDQPGVLIRGVMPEGSHQQSPQRLLTPDGVKFFTNPDGMSRIEHFVQGVTQQIKGK